MAAAPNKYPEELREQAIRMALSMGGATRRQTGCGEADRRSARNQPETLRVWVQQAEVDGGHRPGVTTAEAQRIRELEREVKELRRANEILKTTSAFFAAAELDRKAR